ncbi:hypothetical protein F751_4273 [Auxenochlorella protothecoides]|uniref:Uncharacterized protein n=1 Tax=Auxenochlorella protothecoides TaxID=3075 RepID=A0A087SA75_AUXPR|nr:hypothetical protein F751_4273 [Auxenochlorella protothecoides]KFM22629.1 hypothetical protein F751_4273 [Auxenochlorella protothecoides]
MLFTVQHICNQGMHGDGAPPMPLPLRSRAWMLVVSLATSLRMDEGLGRQSFA